MVLTKDGKMSLFPSCEIKGKEKQSKYVSVYNHFLLGSGVIKKALFIPGLDTLTNKVSLVLGIILNIKSPIKKIASRC